MNKFFSRLFQEKAESGFITVVSGLPRSGTSLMMNMLEAGGMKILCDNLRMADQDNPVGYFEYERVKDLIKGDHAWLTVASGRVVKVISTLLPNLPTNHRYRIVFMRRDMAEILASQKKMLANRGEDPEKIGDTQIAQIFEKNLRQVEEWVELNPDVKRIEVSYNQLIQMPEPLVRRVNEFLGGNLEMDKMMGAINPNLYRQRFAK